MHVYPIAAAVVWGTVAGLALPRPAYRLSVAPEQPWRARCPADVPYPAGRRGWWGPVRNAGKPAAGWRYALVTAVVSAAVAAGTGPRPELTVWLLLVPLGVLLARVDLTVLRLPDVLTLPAATGTAALLGAAALLPGHEGSWPRALLGAAVLGLFYLVLHLVNPDGMGFGDVKLAPTAGMVLAWYGWGTLAAGTFAAFALGAVTGLVLLAARRAERRTPLPFGPFILAGALAGPLLPS
ncbi:A24 family peptidase [Streptomyces sp. PA03-1a]|nr:A24 family peptidase [Streptomyces sp. PA03-1a]MDX2815118.1 A24 family peptidase [Streptomyces sp. PA03-5A]